MEEETKEKDTEIARYVCWNFGFLVIVLLCFLAWYWFHAWIWYINLKTEQCKNNEPDI